MPKFVDLDGGRNVAEIHRKPPRHCHKMIRDSAKAICAEFWEQCSHDNTFHAQFPSQYAYIEQKWGVFVDAAKESLAKMLQGNYPDNMKQKIFEALQYNAAAQGGGITVLQ